MLKYFTVPTSILGVNLLISTIKPRQKGVTFSGISIPAAEIPNKIVAR